MSARRRTSRRVCKALPSRTRSSSLRARESSSATCSILQDLGAQDLKGIGGPVRAWAALRPASVESRFEALHASGLTELVGREEELELLLRRWSKAKTGEGQVVLLSGEAGIGKSRLTAALLERLASRTAHAPALLLFSAAHRQRAVSDHRSDGTRRRICARRHRTSEARQARCAACADLDLHAGCGTVCRDALAAERWTLSRARAGTRAAHGRRTLEALIAQLEALSRSKPVLMIFEDAHWTDPTSLEAFGRVVDRVREPSCAADRDVPSRVRAALDRTALRDGSHHQSAGAARHRGNDRRRRRQQARSRRASGRTSSSAPTAFPCSSRR